MRLGCGRSGGGVEPHAAGAAEQQQQWQQYDRQFAANLRAAACRYQPASLHPPPSTADPDQAPHQKPAATASRMPNHQLVARSAKKM